MSCTCRVWIGELSFRSFLNSCSRLTFSLFYKLLINFWPLKRKQKFLIPFFCTKCYSIPSVSYYFLLICPEMAFKPLFAATKHSVNKPLSWKFVMHLRNPICINLLFLLALLILELQWNGPFVCSRWQADGTSNHRACFVRAVSVYTPFFAVFQSALSSHIVHQRCWQDSN